MIGVASTNSTEEPHWITEIYVVDQSDNIFAMTSLDPTGVDSATWDFTVPKGVESMTAFAWCNIHGLYEGPTVTVDVRAEEERTQKNSAFAVSSAVGFLVSSAFLAFELA